MVRINLNILLGNNTASGAVDDINRMSSRPGLLHDV